MAKFGKSVTSKYLIILKVRFMGEPAKILTLKTHSPTLEAECSLDLAIPLMQRQNFCDVVPTTLSLYTRTPLRLLKPSCRLRVTSSIAQEIVESRR
ncbi:quinolinate synthase NadA [Vibrio chagasii]|nr:quinolinate synthase NadA [Vibrio chagasii]